MFRIYPIIDGMSREKVEDYLPKGACAAARLHGVAKRRGLC